MQVTKIYKSLLVFRVYIEQQICSDVPGISNTGL